MQDSKKIYLVFSRSDYAEFTSNKNGDFLKIVDNSCECARLDCARSNFKCMLEFFLAGGQCKDYSKNSLELILKFRSNNYDYLWKGLFDVQLKRYCMVGRTYSLDTTILFEQIFFHFSTFFENENISCVIFPAIPHELVDFCCLIAAKYCGLRFNVIEKTPFPGYLVAFNDSGQYLKYQNHSGNGDQIWREFINRKREGEPSFWRANKVKKNRDRGLLQRWRGKLVRFRYEYPGFYSSKFYTRGQLSKLSLLTCFVLRFGSVIYDFSLRMEYRSVLFLSWLIVRFERSPNIKAVAFLQVCPEKNNNPGSLWFQDLGVWLSQVRASTFERVFIREHPSQLESFQSLRRGRKVGFYIQALLRGHIFTTKNLLELYKQCSDVVIYALPGSTAVECAALEITCVDFGLSWYRPDINLLFEPKNVTIMGGNEHCGGWGHLCINLGCLTAKKEFYPEDFT